jgi:hypothetical protein
MEKQENCVENRCFILKYTIWSNYENTWRCFLFKSSLARGADKRRRRGIFHFRRGKETHLASFQVSFSLFRG